MSVRWGLKAWTTATAVCAFVVGGWGGRVLGAPVPARVHFRDHVCPNVPREASQAVYAVCCCCLVAQSCLTVCDPMDCSPPGSSVCGISRQEYWSGLPFPSSGDLPNPGIETASPVLSVRGRETLEKWHLSV